MCYGCSVVCYGNSLLICRRHTGFHFGIRYHTSSAVDYEGIFAKLTGELSAGGKFKVYVFTGVFTDEIGELYSADILALPVMGAGFGYKQCVTVI